MYNIIKDGGFTVLCLKGFSCVQHCNSVTRLKFVTSQEIPIHSVKGC